MQPLEPSQNDSACFCRGSIFSTPSSSAPLQDLLQVDSDTSFVRWCLSSWQTAAIDYGLAYSRGYLVEASVLIAHGYIHNRLLNKHVKGRGTSTRIQSQGIPDVYGTLLSVRRTNRNKNWGTWSFSGMWQAETYFPIQTRGARSANAGEDATRLDVLKAVVLPCRDSSTLALQSLLPSCLTRSSFLLQRGSSPSTRFRVEHLTFQSRPIPPTTGTNFAVCPT